MIVPSPYYRSPCETCGGTGIVHDIAPVRGEAIDCDILAHDCEDCEGVGSFEDEPVCGCCEGPLDKFGWCASCEELCGAVMVERIAPGRIAA